MLCFDLDNGSTTLIDTSLVLALDRSQIELFKVIFLFILSELIIEVVPFKFKVLCLLRVREYELVKFKLDHSGLLTCVVQLIF